MNGDVFNSEGESALSSGPDGGSVGGGVVEDGDQDEKDQGEKRCGVAVGDILCAVDR